MLTPRRVFLPLASSVSICFFRDEWRPDSFYNKIKANVENQFHTLCLLGTTGEVGTWGTEVV